MGFYTRAGNDGHIPSEESTGCGISGEGGRVLEAAGTGLMGQAGWCVTGSAKGCQPGFGMDRMRPVL